MTHAFQAAILGIVQGLAEFLPISSSAHLVLVRWIFGWSEFVGGPAVEKAFDVMLHAGTFVAVVWYFWADLKEFFSGKHNKLVFLLILSTIPGALFGVLFEKAAEEKFSAPYPIAIFMILLGIILLLAEWLANHRKNLEQLTIVDSILIGIAQAFALFPGVSRSGITMTTALFLGVKRTDAARYSFLMSIPIIAGAIVWEGHKLVKMHLPMAALMPFFWGFLTSAIVGYVTIRVFLRYLSHGSFYPFVIYRIVVGAAILFYLHH